MAESPTQNSEHRRGDSSAVAEECSPSVWLLKEYELLTIHYFHEDNYILRTVSLFGTLNGALLAFMASNFFDASSRAKLFIPAIGMVLSLAWLISLVRTRAYRIYHESRIRAIEQYLNTQWKFLEFQLLDLRTFSSWDQMRQSGLLTPLPLRAFAQIPSSIMMMAIPIGFLIIWIILESYKL
jgi:hypothetical protein